MEKTITKKFIFMIFGAGKDHFPIIKRSYLKNNYNIVIHNKNSEKVKKFSNKFFKTSVYDIKEVAKICKLLKKKNIKIDNLICRTTGPSILSAHYVFNFFKIKRVSSTLAKCVYSKSFLSKFLKKNKLPYINSQLITKKFKKTLKGKWILKPDAPILGKKFIFMINNQKISKHKLQIVVNNSHNKRANLSKYLQGLDINTIFIEKNKKKFLLNIMNEWNFFVKQSINQNNNHSVAGLSSPEIGIDKNTKKKIINISKKIIKLFPEYYGFISITFRVNKNFIYPYEINVNIDRLYSRKIFPYFFKDLSTYNLEVSNLMNQKHGKLFIKAKKKFIGIFREKTLFSNLKLKKYLLNYASI